MEKKGQVIALVGGLMVALFVLILIVLRLRYVLRIRISKQRANASYPSDFSCLNRSLSPIAATHRAGKQLTKNNPPAHCEK